MGYKIGKVYRITKIDDPTINYVGSTFGELKLRWYLHKQNNSSCSIKEYFDKYGVDKFKIILIKEYEVYAENQKDNKHLKAYEQLWINKFKLKNCCVNKINCMKLLPEKIYSLLYRSNNIEKIQQANKKYQEVNKKKILKQAKEYREANREKILEQKKEYREANREKINEKAKEYREANREKTNEKAKEKVNCLICNSLISRGHLARHKKSKKCMEFQ